MAVKSERLETRASPEQRQRIEWAAAFTGTSVSAFIIDSAVQRADELVAEHSTTVVPAKYFDELLRTLDAPDEAPNLAKASRSARRRSRITR